MRTKLSDLISTIDQYNGLLKNDKEYVGGATVDIETDLPDFSGHVVVSENHKREIEGLLLTENTSCNHEDTCISKTVNQKYVLTYEDFLQENFQKRPPQDPDYDDRPKGWNDYDDEEEE